MLKKTFLLFILIINNINSLLVVNNLYSIKYNITINRNVIHYCNIIDDFNVYKNNFILYKK